MRVRGRIVTLRESIRQTGSSRRGFTLAEAMIAVAILAVSVLAITEMIVAGQMATYEAMHQRRGQSLVEAMMEEVISKPYDDPDEVSAFGPEVDEVDREDFDNTDDFDGWTEDFGDIVDATGAAYGTGFARFSRAVTCAAASQTVGGLSVTVDGLDVTVTVTDDRGSQWQTTRFIPETAD